MIEAYTRFKLSVNWDFTVVKKLGLSSLLEEELRSEDESDERASDDETRKCRVSGIKPIRKVPNIRKDTPRRSGIHGDLAINVEAIEGAMSSAKSPAHAPNRKTFALESVQPLFVSYYTL